ncbi:hypothetical protein [Reichenbachiella ulvae]|uniref:Uncharacterized protein n=1 Tax=Reichenbachiella ulvae TaxID=2980104 RepID=A0ABT3CX80_9BACT|nr:hypothetical protein [Reichenbachiella ulvae]MCV9388308.1 hypothetical protein [Reichenbachiella ulvae]
MHFSRFRRLENEEKSIFGPSAKLQNEEKRIFGASALLGNGEKPIFGPSPSWGRLPNAFFCFPQTGDCRRMDVWGLIGKAYRKNRVYSVNCVNSLVVFLLISWVVRLTAGYLLQETEELEISLISPFW